MSEIIEQMERMVDNIINEPWMVLEQQRKCKQQLIAKDSRLKYHDHIFFE